MAEMADRTMATATPCGTGARTSASWARRVARRLRGARPAREGDWLFEAGVLGWMRTPALYQQLPFDLRLFATLCRARVPRGGRRLFELAMWFNRHFGRGEPLRLEVADKIVYLDRQDPRMLQVPRELDGSSPIARWIEAFVSAGDTFVDVGANHGSFSIVAGHRVGPAGRVLAIEPQPRLNALVQTSLAEIHGLRFEVHGIACGDQCDRVHFFIPRGSSGSAGLFRGYSAQGRHTQVEVDVQTLDRVLADREFPGRMFVKIDVEGAEPAVLRGAAGTIRRHQPSIVLEINRLAMAAANTTIDWFREHLTRCGYAHYSVIEQDWNDRRPLSELGKAGHRNIVVWSPTAGTGA